MNYIFLVSGGKARYSLPSARLVLLEAGIKVAPRKQPFRPYLGRKGLFL